MDYILADLIGKSAGRFISKDMEYPTVEEVYSSLFEDKQKEKAEQKQKLRDDLSVLRFKQFVSYHNSKRKGGS